jgi:hypothetical protein
MSSYRLISASALDHAARRYPPIDWPTKHLAVGEAFVVALTDGVDADGRSEAYLRVIADKHGRRYGMKFSCRKTTDGLAVIRIA